MLKKILLAFLILLALLIAGILLGSIDADSYDDLGLLDVLEDVPDEQNGYSVVSYLFDRNYVDHTSGQFSHGDTGTKLKSYVYFEQWDDNTVGHLLANNKQHIDNVISATQYPQFKIALPADPKLLPRYEDSIFVSRLVVLRAMQAAKNGRYDEAIQLTAAAIIFSQQVKSESNHLLISRMIGLVSQYEALQWCHYFMSHYTLNQYQLSALHKAITTTPSYKNDSFEKVFSGELRYSTSMNDYLYNQSVSQKWRGLEAIFETWAYFEESGQVHTAKDRVSQLLSSILPRYSTHPNRMFEKVAQNNYELAQQAGYYCDKIELRPTVKPAESSWFDILRPNGSLLYFLADQSMFRDYFTRRCFAHAYVESIQTIVAMQTYKLDKGALPENLNELVPDYLDELPVDPFNGQTLEYSKADQWLYSVGTNFEDNGGSKAAYFVRRCENNEDCTSNPTFPIVYIAPYTSGRGPKSSYANTIER